MVSLVSAIAFWKKREPQPAQEAQRIIPLPPFPSQSTEVSRTTSQEAVNASRDALKVLKLERQILGNAVTTIYESCSKGVIDEQERDRLLEKYKVDLTRLEKAIAENQRVVDLFDLESARESLMQDFKRKMAEIDAQVKTLKSGGSLAQRPKTSHEAESGSNPTKEEGKDTQGNKGSTDHEQPANKTSEIDQQQIADAEKRIEQIRSEILKAMDRLEQIESEG